MNAPGQTRWSLATSSRNVLPFHCPHPFQQMPASLNARLPFASPKQAYGPRRQNTINISWRCTEKKIPRPLQRSSHYNRSRRTSSPRLGMTTMLPGTCEQMALTRVSSNGCPPLCPGPRAISLDPACNCEYTPMEETACGVRQGNRQRFQLKSHDRYKAPAAHMQERHL